MTDFKCIYVIMAFAIFHELSDQRDDRVFIDFFCTNTIRPITPIARYNGIMVVKVMIY